MKNLFITIEGIEGVGKSTAIHFVASYLEARQLPLCVTREPGGTAIGEQIRHILLAPASQEMVADTELLLFFASRAQHLTEVIKPALAAGKSVICDRFTDASYAYQVGGRGIAAEKVTVLENWVQGELRPNFTLLLDAPVEVALARAKGRQAVDRIEAETVSFFEKVRAYYLQRAEGESERFKIIDAQQSLLTVQSDIQQWLQQIYPH